MNRLLKFLAIILLFVSGLNSQTVREFRLGVWGLFPWVYPNQAERDYLRDIHVNNIAAWLINTDSLIYPQEYIHYYGDNFSTENILWLEREWMDYLDSLQLTGENVKMYVGHNGSNTPEQSKSQIEYYADNGSMEDFKQIFNLYRQEFGNRPALGGYVISHEDLGRADSSRQRVASRLKYIDSVGVPTNQEIVVMEGYALIDPEVQQWLIENIDLFDVFENYRYAFIENIYDGDAYQNAINEKLMIYLEICKSIFQYSNTDWHFIFQTYQDSTRRWPTETEINLQSYLALSRGARGIKCFLYGSETVKNNLNGLLENVYSNGMREKHLANYPNGNFYPFEFVAKLYSKLELLGPIFSQLEVEDAYLTSHENDVSDKFLEVKSGNYIEAGIFNNRVTPNADEKYFLLVNRVTNQTDGSPASAQYIISEIRWDENEFYTISDMLEETQYLVASDHNGIIEFKTDIPPGEGRLFKISKTGSFWEGSFIVPKTLSIPAEQKITIGPGSNFKFAPESGLEIYGQFDGSLHGRDSAQFTCSVKDSVSKWQGIKISDEADVIFEHCIFENAIVGVELNSCNNVSILHSEFKNNNRGLYIAYSRPIVKSNTFLNCDEAIRVYHSYNPQDWEANSIENNFIKDSDIGILLIDSSPTMVNNSLMSNSKGIISAFYSKPVLYKNVIDSSGINAFYCLSGSSPDIYFNHIYQTGGYNTFSNSGNYGIYIEDDSFPFLGEFRWDGGYNILINNNGYEVYNKNQATINMQFNWWGNQNGPSRSEVYGPISWIPPLKYNPLKTRTSIANEEQNELKSEKNDLQYAQSELISGNYETAAMHYKNYLLSEENDVYSNKSMSGFLKSNEGFMIDGGIINEIENMQTKVSNDKLHNRFEDARINIMIRSGQYHEAIERINQLIESNLTREESNKLLLQKALILIYDLKDSYEGKQILSNIIRDSGIQQGSFEFALSELENLTNDTEKNKTKNSLKLDSINESISFRLLGNFPNPFNPNTRIRLILPDKSDVEVTIYNMIGERIREIRRNAMLKGTNDIFWDGRNESKGNVSSGIYIYHIKVKSLENNNVDLKSSKMLLIR